MHALALSHTLNRADSFACHLQHNRGHSLGKNPFHPALNTSAKTAQLLKAKQYQEYRWQYYVGTSIACSPLQRTEYIDFSRGVSAATTVMAITQLAGPENR